MGKNGKERCNYQKEFKARAGTVTLAEKWKETNKPDHR
jgi:hypothetical protein